MQPLAQALPPVRGRGRNRPRVRGRQAGQPAMGVSQQTSSNVVVNDTEVLGSTTGALQVFEFHPHSSTSAPRLAQFAKMYHRYRFLQVSIAYKSGSGTNVTGNVALGIAPGTAIDSIKTQDNIVKLRPSFYVPIWKNESITVGRTIDSQRTMLTKDSAGDNDSSSFTLYVYGNKGGGMIQISYKIEFSYPIPF